MTTDRRPSRAIAILLEIFAGCGVGHFYLGLKRRGIIWFASVSLAAVGVAASLPALGGGIGHWLSFGAFFVVLVGGWLGPIVDLARLQADRFVRVPAWKVFLFWLAIVFATTVLRLSIRGLFLEAFKIPSGAMWPTLLIGDYIYVDKLVYKVRDPHRGELMVFASPEHADQDFVKRVTLAPGDKLEVRGGHPWINNWEVPHCRVGSATLQGDGEFPTSSGDVEVEFLDGEAYLTFYDSESRGFTTAQGTYVAAADEYWVLGDNRNKSNDSRMWFGGRGGGVPKHLIKGKALFAWLGVSNEAVDWSRVGLSLSEPRLPVSMRDLQPGLERCMQSRPPYDETVPPRP